MTEGRKWIRVMEVGGMNEGVVCVVEAGDSGGYSQSPKIDKKQ